MIDIREHGGKVGGGNKIDGNKVSLVAADNIKDGDFVSFSSGLESPNLPTHSNLQAPYNYISSDTNGMSYSDFRSITSDKGNVIMIRGYNTQTDRYVLKPYLDSNGKLSAVNYAFILTGYIYSVTKLDSNTFVIFHSTTYESYGVKASIIRIRDDTGQPYLLSTTVINSSRYYKNFYYIPNDDTNLTGIVLYNKGAHNVGYSDNVTLYLGNITISPNFSSVNLPTEDINIKYTSGESYGNCNNIRYLQDNSGIIFNAHGNVYKITWDNIVTTVSTGVSSSLFDAYTIIFNVKDENRVITINTDGTVISITYNENNVATSTNMISSPGYFNVLKPLFGVFDRKYLIRSGINLNPQLARIFKPIGSFAFVTLVSTGNSNAPGNTILPLVYYFSYDFKSVKALVRDASTIMAANQYVEGNIWMDVDDDLTAKIIYTVYNFVEGYGSYRYKYSVISSINGNTTPMRVTNKKTESHGISNNSAQSDGVIKCTINKLIDIKYL